MTISNLENCNSLEDVVALVNNEFATDAESEEIAAAYAIDGAIEAGYGTGEAELCAQLDALRDAGAGFDYPGALNEALKHSGN